MIFNIDSAIFIVFLIVTIVVGLLSSRGTNSIKQYAIGDRNFSTATIAATIVATWISGIFFYSGISETYTKGLYSIWITIGDPIYLLCIGLFFAPRMGEFMGKLSIAEAMGGLYGKKVRIITALASFIGAAAMVSVQLKLAGIIFEYALDIPNYYGVIIATIIVTLYSALGGIKSVTFTDVIQFFTFGAVIPVCAYAILTNIDNLNIVTNMINTNPLFDYKEVFNFSNSLSLKQLFLFLLFIVPRFNPSMFQRISMSKNTKQASNSFIIASLVCLIFALIVNWISILTLSIDPSLKPNDAIKHVIFNSSYIGLKGAILAGVMAMIMSTIDSWINSTSVIIVHDFFKPLKFGIIKNEIFSARVVSIILGVSSLYLSLREGTLLELLLSVSSIYWSTIPVSFTMAIIGFRSTEKSVLLAMTAGLVTILLWDYILKITATAGIPVAMLVNLITLIASHYLLKQEGGWVGIKDPKPLIEIRNQRKLRFKKFVEDMKNFNIVKICNKNCPRGDGLISMVGLFIMISVFSSTHTLAKEYQLQYADLLNALYPIALFTSATLISYPLWLPTWKESGVIGICWNFIAFFVLICFSFLMLLISDYSEMQLMVFMINIIIVSSLATWRWSLFMIITAVAFVTIIYQQHLQIYTLNDSLSSQFKIIYFLMLISSTLIIFLKPKQEYQEFTEAKNEHLSSRIGSKDQETQEALALKAEFIRNINHEYHAPMTGIISMADTLVESYHKLNDQQRLNAAEVILKSSHSLKSFDNNITTLARLSKPHYALKKENIDLSLLSYDRIEICRKLYEENKDDREFILNIDENIMANVDKHYMTQLLDNLIINSINYCKKGRIKVNLTQDKNNIHLVISDTGIGIPTDELYEIFEPFTVSSRTKTPAGGRGVGLAICKRILEIHNGTIKAESDGKTGASFVLILPISYSVS